MNNITETINSYDFCPYRLPCGYCEKLGRDCPKMTFTINYDDNTLTAIKNGQGLTAINTTDTNCVGIYKEE